MASPSSKVKLQSQKCHQAAADDLTRLALENMARTIGKELSTRLAEFRKAQQSSVALSEQLDQTTPPKTRQEVAMMSQLQRQGSVQNQVGSRMRRTRIVSFTNVGVVRSCGDDGRDSESVRSLLHLDSRAGKSQGIGSPFLLSGVDG